MAAGAEQAGLGAAPLRVSQSHMNGAAPLAQLASGIVDLNSSPDSSPSKVWTCSVYVAVSCCIAPHRSGGVVCIWFRHPCLL